MRLHEIAASEEYVVVQDVVEVVHRLAQLEAAREWPFLFVSGVEAGRVGAEQVRHGDVYFSVSVLQVTVQIR